MNEQINLPTHIAVIMDGNRRWAKQHHLDAKLGHKKGAQTLENIVRYCNKIGLQYLTVYAFSTENWKRSKEEVGNLMQLFNVYLHTVITTDNTENVRIKILGDKSVLSKALQKSIKEAEERTKDNTGLTLCIALNYGGRDEITKAVQKIVNDTVDNKISIKDINQDLISSYLYTKGIPDPDLLVRTSGEMRTSGFLPWQLVYTEFVFVEKYWPEFDEKDLDEVIEIYEKRNRKYGGK